jgi:hypothetical protein
MTVLDHLAEIDEELTLLMTSRRTNPAQAILHALRISSIVAKARVEYLRERQARDLDFELALIVGEVPANGVES